MRGSLGKCVKESLGARGFALGTTLQNHKFLMIRSAHRHLECALRLVGRNLPIDDDLVIQRVLVTELDGAVGGEDLGQRAERVLRALVAGP